MHRTLERRGMENAELSQELDAARVELRRAWLQLGYADIEGARGSCGRAKALAPDHPLPHAIEGAIEQAAGNLKRALALLRKVTRRWPDAPCGHIYHAETCLLMGRVRQGERSLEKASEVDHDNHWLEQREDLRSLLENLDATLIPPPLELEALGVSE